MRMLETDNIHEWFSLFNNPSTFAQTISRYEQRITSLVIFCIAKEQPNQSSIIIYRTGNVSIQIV